MSAKKTETAKKSDKAARVAAVLARIAEGESVTAACAAVGMPRTTFLASVDRQQYALAREACADAHFDALYELEKLVLEGDINPTAFRAMLDSCKWRLARMKPKLYGDKLGVEHSGSIDLAAAINKARKRLSGKSAPKGSVGP